MKHPFAIILLAFALCASTYGQTIKALSYNTTNGNVVYTGTNALRFVDNVSFDSDVFGLAFEAASGSNFTQITPDGIDFSGPTQKATTRTNLGFPLPALTNTSNVTMMRALAGSTNTNHPFSGTVSVVGTNNTNTLTFSNGILQSVQ